MGGIDWGDYIWLDGCNLNYGSMPNKYELWSKLLNESGRQIPWEVSWPAYTYKRYPDPVTTGNDPFNQDLWYHATAVGHEVRVYNDNAANWKHILDIASFGHEAQLSKYHRPGSYAFLDMLESGIGYLSFAESRAHFGLWVIMAQPLHVAMDLRTISAELLDTITNREVLSVAVDPMVKMGYRARYSDGPLNGTQIWARELSDGSRLVGLLNAMDPHNNCTWEHRTGGYYQVIPATSAGNFMCGNYLNIEEAQAVCCAAGTKRCVSIDRNVESSSGCAKMNDDGGWVNDSQYEDFIITRGHPDPITPVTQICVNWTDIGLNPYQNASVRNLWDRRDLGWHSHGFCMPAVDQHDIILLHIDQ